MDSKLSAYLELVRSWPGLSGRPDRALVEDGLALLPHLEQGASVIDVGSGGGMPGLPLRIARPDLRLTLLEADRRKAAFLVHAAAELELEEVAVVAERAEIAARGPLRETFVAAVCRALAPTPVALELCLPFVRLGGRLLVMTTVAGDDEESRQRLDGVAARLGGGRASSIPAPTAARERGAILEILKERPTPPAYPRRPGLPG
ncbi:MAG: class I SAM-dependent methyltransferase, partial [Candidatus Dormibacteraeota bacterium]|nr:class I SAM-dependent methyltransferase [Candidatus Dormibacteraeota bacterium]